MNVDIVITVGKYYGPRLKHLKGWDVETQWDCQLKLDNLGPHDVFSQLELQLALLWEMSIPFLSATLTPSKKETL